MIKNAFENIKLGNLGFTPFVVDVDGNRIEKEYDIIINAKAKTAHIFLKDLADFKDDFYITYEGEEVIVKRTFENVSSDTIKITEIGADIDGIVFDSNAKDDYFYHVDNPRNFKKMTFSVDVSGESIQSDAQRGEFDEDAGTRWFDPMTLNDRIGSSPFQPFPAILLSNYNTTLGLVHGTLSQNVFAHEYHTLREDGALKLRVFSTFKAIAYRELSPGEVLTDEWYLGTTHNADDIEKIFENYSNQLRKKLPASYGSTKINRDNMVWGTWNDGILRNVNEELVLREAQFLKENFPTVRWIQLDDGYATYNENAHGLGVYYEGEEGIDKVKFPHGLRYVSDKIREIGLHPALWIGGKCHHDTKIAMEKPEWFAKFDHSPKMKVLDPSISTVREYMTKAVHHLCENYGFEAVKHDFWSYAFERFQDMLKVKNKSGYEHRKWWLKEIRSALASDGYFQTGCDIVMANPFLGEYFTNYRYGIDIGSGNWQNVKTNYLWGIACFATHTGDLFVPNSDSVGTFPGLTEDEAMFNINYCLTTHSMVEIAGVLSQTTDRERVKILKKAVCNPNNGQDVYFANYDYRRKEYCVPEVMYFKTPHFSTLENAEGLPVRTVGLFNVEDEAKTIGFSIENLGLPKDSYIITDVWSGEQFEIEDRIEFEIRAHASRLLAVSKKEDISLYDANIRINGVKVSGKVMELCLDYETKDVEFTFSAQVKKIEQNGKELEFIKDGEKTVLTNVQKGIVKVSF